MKQTYKFVVWQKWLQDIDSEAQLHKISTTRKEIIKVNNEPTVNDKTYSEMCFSFYV